MELQKQQQQQQQQAQQQQQVHQLSLLEGGDSGGVGNQLSQFIQLAQLQQVDPQQFDQLKVGNTCMQGLRDTCNLYEKFCIGRQHHVIPQNEKNKTCQ